MPSDALLKLSPKNRACGACEIRGRQLAPAMWQFDNIEDVAAILELGRVPYEEWTTDQRSGLLNIPGRGCVRIGGYIVVDGHDVLVYRSRDEMLRHYDIVNIAERL